MSLLCLHPIFAQDTNTVQVFTKALNQLVEIVNPPAEAAPRTFTTTLKILKADGLPTELVGREIALAFQSPDHVRIAAKWEGEDFVLGRNVQELWVYAPGKRFGVVGKPGVARFSNVPDSKDNSVLAPIKLPVDKDQLAIVPMLMKLVALPNESIGGSACRVIKATLMPEAIEAFKLPDATLQVWIRESDSLLTRVSYRQGKTDVEVELQKPQFVAAWPAEKWQLKAGAGEVVETVAQSHVSRFLEVSLAMLGQKIPTLGPPTGERRVLAREGDGRLEMIDGTRVLHLQLAVLQHRGARGAGTGHAGQPLAGQVGRGPVHVRQLHHRADAQRRGQQQHGGERQRQARADAQRAEPVRKTRDDLHGRGPSGGGGGLRGPAAGLHFL